MNENTQPAQNPIATSSTRDFAVWALETLKCPVHESSNGGCSFAVAEDHRERFGGAEHVQIQFETPSSANGDEANGAPVEEVSLSSDLFEWIVSQLREHIKVAHAAPENVAESVHAISPRLFESYEVDGGHVQLAGCTLDDWPLLRLTYRQGGAIVHLFFQRDGSSVDEAMRNGLHLNDVTAVARRTRDMTDEEIGKWIAAVEPMAREKLGTAANDRIAVTLVWCKLAQGKLAFSIGEAEATTMFSGWAQHFADGILKPPPFRCPKSGQESYHLAATDDGQITVADAIKTCCESGRKMIVTDLEQCAATGNLAAPEFLVDCPVSGERVLPSALAECTSCGQPVSPATLRGEQCSACRGIRAVAKDEPTVVRLLDEYPGLDRRRGWQLSETSQVYVFVAKGLLKSLLIVVDRQDFAVKRLATRGRFARNWTAVPEEASEAILGRNL